MPQRVLNRYDSAANWKQYNPVLGKGEHGYESDTEQYKIGDGVSSWSQLEYRGLPAVQQTGSSKTQVMSQEAVTVELGKRDSEINKRATQVDLEKEKAKIVQLEQETSAIQTNVNNQLQAQDVDFQQKAAAEFEKNKNYVDGKSIEITPASVTPETLSEATKQLINTAGGGSVTNLADDEDLISKDNVLKFKDKAYQPSNFSGLGRKILRKNIDGVSGKNTLTQVMVSQPNTIYEIQYDYDLEGHTITIPEGCTLNFTGGSISNGILVLTSTCVSAPLYTIFKNIILEGNSNGGLFYPQWFGAKHNTESTDAVRYFFSYIDVFKNAEISENYIISNTISISGSSINIKGTGEFKINNCNGFIVDVSKSNISLNIDLNNSPEGNSTGVKISGTNNEISINARITDSISNWDSAVETIACYECIFYITARGRGATFKGKKYGNGIKTGYGINNSYIGCRTLYTKRGLFMPISSPVGESYTNEGALYTSCHFLAAEVGAEINVTTYTAFDNCLIDLCDKHALFINGTSRCSFSNTWLAVTNDYLTDGTDYALVLTDSTKTLLQGLFISTPRSNGVLIQNSKWTQIDNIVNASHNNTPTSFSLRASNDKIFIISPLIGFNIANEGGAYIYNWSNNNYNARICNTGDGLLPNEVITNGYGGRVVQAFDGIEPSFVIEVFPNSNNSMANNFQIGKTAKGVLIRSSGPKGWVTEKIKTVDIHKLEIGSSSSRPVLSMNDASFTYYDTTLRKSIMWSGDSWVNLDGANLIKTGTSSDRPTTYLEVGYIYKDTTLNKLIIWDGEKWINLDGTTLT